MPTTVSTTAEWLVSPELVSYPVAVETMRRRVAGIRGRHESEQIWLLEHPALYTAGTSAQSADLAHPDRFPTFSAGRGGQWTYHGPGQLVAYVMLDLLTAHGRVPPRDTHAYVSALEISLIRTLAVLGVEAGRRTGRVGVWITDARTGAESKIAAIGVRITRWVTWHGVSLNVCPNLEHFSGIVPCGIREHGVTSLHAEGLPVTMDQARSAFRASFSEVFGLFSSGAASFAAPLAKAL